MRRIIPEVCGGGELGGSAPGWDRDGLRRFAGCDERRASGQRGLSEPPKGASSAAASPERGAVSPRWSRREPPRLPWALLRSRRRVTSRLGLAKERVARSGDDTGAYSSMLTVEPVRVFVTTSFLGIFAFRSSTALPERSVTMKNVFTLSMLVVIEPPV